MAKGNEGKPQAQKVPLWSVSLILLMIINFCGALAFYLLMVIITD